MLMWMIGSARHQGRRERATCTFDEVLGNRTSEGFSVAIQDEPLVFRRAHLVQPPTFARLVVLDRWWAAPRMVLEERQRQSRTFDRGT
jgi:hypothetical protein